MSERPPISPRSPRAALEPEQVPPPPKRSDRARNPFVIVGNAIITLLLISMVGACGPHARIDDQEIFAQFSAQGFPFPRRAHDSGATGVQGGRSEPYNLIHNRAGHAG